MLNARSPAGGERSALSRASKHEVVVDGQRRMVGKALVEVDRLTPGQRRRSGRGQLVVNATKNLQKFPAVSRR